MKKYLTVICMFPFQKPALLGLTYFNHASISCFLLVCYFGDRRQLLSISSMCCKYFSLSFLLNFVYDNFFLMIEVSNYFPL